MRITVYYENGLTEDFDTLNFTAAEPFKADRATNLLTDFQLQFDRLMTDGLILDVYYYEAATDNPCYTDTNQGIQIPLATRRLGWRMLLVSKQELENAVLIIRDGELFAWRQETEWINAIQFRLQEILCFSSASTDSINRKATILFHYLKNAHPSLSDPEISALMGFPYEAYERIQKWESENIDFEESLDATLESAVAEL